MLWILRLSIGWNLYLTLQGCPAAVCAWSQQQLRTAVGTARLLTHTSAPAGPPPPRGEKPGEHMWLVFPAVIPPGFSDCQVKLFPWNRLSTHVQICHMNCLRLVLECSKYLLSTCRVELMVTGPWQCRCTSHGHTSFLEAVAWVPLAYVYPLRSLDVRYLQTFGFLLFVLRQSYDGCLLMAGIKDKCHHI